MRRRPCSTARALRAFVAGEDSDWSWAGALIVGEMIEDIRSLKVFSDQYKKALSKRPRRK